MNFIEALELAKKGKKIRLKKWDNPEFYLYAKQDSLYCCGDRNILSSLNMTEYSSLDWEEYKKKLELNTFEKAIVALKNGKTIKRVSVPQWTYNLEVCNFNEEEVMANDWIIVEEEV
jgi:uridine kinase